MNTKTKHWAGITAGILSLSGYASAANLGSEKYIYDASGNIVEKSIDGQVTQMTYDSSNRLTERQATGQSNETTAYDAAGRPIDLKDGTGQPMRSMRYGYGDKVLETKNHGSNTGFFYNAEGQLVGKKTESGVATYTWDGNVVATVGTEIFVNEDHVTGGLPLLASDDSVLVVDHLGNTLSQGSQQFAGTAYGEGMDKARFTGKLFIEEFGSFVFQSRLYSPQSNCWTTLDPAGFPNGTNSTAYVDGDPLTRVDPSGTTWLTYNTFLTNTPSSTGPTASRAVTNTIDEESYYEVSYSQGAQADFQSIPASVTWNSSYTTTDAVTFGGSATFYKAITISGSSTTTTGSTNGKSVTVNRHANDPSKCTIYKEDATATKMVRYISTTTPNPAFRPSTTVTPEYGFSTQILGKPEYEN